MLDEKGEDCAKEDLTTFAEESDKSIQLARDSGIIVDLSKWLTLKRYAQKYNLRSTNVLSNWINRGIIKAENILDLPELNDLRLIRDIPYNLSSTNSNA